ncbi:SOS-response transcriptional repressor LexA [Janthinobacterium sp. 61]|uniref:LexA family protein n=1 Tax=Janthinobacterium sp. 61 TaxID=2035209 RepID=UPI000C70963A|nr:S24 family peptidase [Janthinobacterium sp. 61]PKV44464.1 SOS-response transcriptional repressor LexA [Janthinobacterium sp. 61]
MIRNTKKNGAGKPAPRSNPSKAKPASAGLSPLEAFIIASGEFSADDIASMTSDDTLPQKETSAEAPLEPYGQWLSARKNRDDEPFPTQMRSSIQIPSTTGAGMTAEEKHVARIASAITHAKKQVRINGDSMRDLGIKDGDMVDVELNAEPKDGDIVCADVIGIGRIIRTLRIIDGAHILTAANPAVEAIPIIDRSHMRILGIVITLSSSIH